MQTREQKARLLAACAPLFSVKSVKVRPALDGVETSCTLYLNGKAIGKHHDRGDGVMEGHFRFKSDAIKAEFEKVVKDNDFQKLVHETGYSFLELKEINTYVILDAVIDSLANEHMFQADVKRLTKNKLVFGSRDKLRYFGFPKIKVLADILKYKDGLKVLQDCYDDVKKKLEEGEEVFNPDEQLKSLGVKL